MLTLMLLFSSISLNWGWKKTLHGVHPDDYSKYEADGTFDCSEKAIPIHAINDNYLDCVDGRDEPGTAASSMTSMLFYCQNDGYRSSSVPTAYVNDGICDCCDGSDEFDMKTLTSPCTNTCQELGLQVLQDAKHHLDVVQKGFQERKQRIHWAKSLKMEQLRNQTKLQESIDQYISFKQRMLPFLKYEEMLERELQQRAVEEKIEQVETTGECLIDDPHCSRAPSGSPADGISYFLSMPIDLSSGHKMSLKSFMESQQNMIDREITPTVGDKKRNGFMGPIFNNGKQGIRDGLAILLRGAGFLLLPVRLVWEILAFLSPRLVIESLEKTINALYVEWFQLYFRRFYHGTVYKIFRSIKWAWETAWNGPLDFYLYFCPRLNRNVTRPEADSLRNVVAIIEEEIELNVKYKKDLMKTSVEDYGPSLEYQFLKGKCIETQIQKYRYKVCLYDKVWQDTLQIGSFVRWGTEREPSKWSLGKSYDYSSMYFSNGAICYNGPKREALVQLKCGEHDDVVDVEEPHLCFYVLTVTTPSACTKEVVQLAKDHVEQLIKAKNENT